MKKGLMFVICAGVCTLFSAVAVLADPPTSVNVSVSLLSDSNLPTEPTTFTVYTDNEGMTEMTGLYLSPAGYDLTDPTYYNFRYIAGHAYVSITENSDKWYLVMYTHETVWYTNQLLNQSFDSNAISIRYMNEIFVGDWDLPVGYILDQNWVLRDGTVITPEQAWSSETYGMFYNIPNWPGSLALSESNMPYQAIQDFDITNYKIPFPYSSNRIHLIFALDINTIDLKDKAHAPGVYSNNLSFEMIVYP